MGLAEWAETYCRQTACGEAPANVPVISQGILMSSNETKEDRTHRHQAKKCAKPFGLKWNELWPSCLPLESFGTTVGETTDIEKWM